MLQRPKAMFLYVTMNIKKSLKKSEPVAHLEQKNDHYFTRRILCNAPSNARTFLYFVPNILSRIAWANKCLITIPPSPHQTLISWHFR